MTDRDSEIIRRFAEVELIDDDEIRRETLDAFKSGVPDYFYNVPATGSGRYHNPFSRRKHGLWIHTKMVFTAYERFVDSFLQMGLITETEANGGRAAVLLHDMFKYGPDYEDGDTTVKNHDKLAGSWLEMNTGLPKATVRAVKTHNGPYYSGPAPEYAESPIEMLVHMADLAASTKNITCGIYKPASEISGRYPNIPRSDL